MWGQHRQAQGHSNERGEDTVERGERTLNQPSKLRVAGSIPAGRTKYFNKSDRWKRNLGKTWRAENAHLWSGANPVVASHNAESRSRIWVDRRARSYTSTPSGVRV